MEHMDNSKLFDVWFNVIIEHERMLLTALVMLIGFCSAYITTANMPLEVFVGAFVSLLLYIFSLMCVLRIMYVNQKLIEDIRDSRNVKSMEEHLSLLDKLKYHFLCSGLFLSLVAVLIKGLSSVCD